MNGRSLLKSILLFILVSIAYFYTYVSYENIITNFKTSESFLEILFNIYFLIFPITLGLNLLFIKKKKKVLSIIFGLINLYPTVYYLFNIVIREWIEFKSFNVDNLIYYFLMILTSMFILSLNDLKEKTNPLNDFLTMLVTVIMILIFYRYYIDPHFLHNIFHQNYSNTSIHYGYIEQYLPTFILMYLILLVGKKINNLN